jgi:hypothetical protein
MCLFRRDLGAITHDFPISGHVMRFTLGAAKPMSLLMRHLAHVGLWRSTCNLGILAKYLFPRHLVVSAALRYDEKSGTKPPGSSFSNAMGAGLSKRSLK